MRRWPAGRLGSRRWGRGRSLGRSGRDDGDDGRRRGSSDGITRGRSLDLLGSLGRTEVAMSQPLADSCESITNLAVGALNSEEAETSGDSGGD